MDYEKLLNNCGICTEGDAQSEEKKEGGEGEIEIEDAETPAEETEEAAQ